MSEARTAPDYPALLREYESWTEIVAPMTIVASSNMTHTVVNFRCELTPTDRVWHEPIEDEE